MNFIKLTLWGQADKLFLAIPAIASFVPSESGKATVITTLYGINHKVDGSPATVMETILQAQAEYAVGTTGPRATSRFADEVARV